MSKYDFFSKYEKCLKSDDPKRLQEFKKFVKKKEDLGDNYNKDGYSILTLSCKDGNKEIVKFLLQDCKLNPDAWDENGDSGIHYAASQAFKDIIELLVDFGSDVNIKNGKQETPLILAVGSNKPATVKLLLSFGADTNIGNTKPLDIAREKGFTRMFSLFESTHSYDDAVSKPESLYQRLNSVEGIVNRASSRNKLQYVKEIKHARAALDSAKTEQLGEIEKKIRQLEISHKGMITRIDTAEKRMNTMEDVVKGLDATQKQVSETQQLMAFLTQDIKIKHEKLDDYTKNNTSDLYDAVNKLTSDYGMY